MFCLFVNSTPLPFYIRRVVAHLALPVNPNLYFIDEMTIFVMTTSLILTNRQIQLQRGRSLPLWGCAILFG
jgi:hypothetical protein